MCIRDRIKTATDFFGLKNCERIDVEKLVALFLEMRADNMSLKFASPEEMVATYAPSK